MLRRAADGDGATVMDAAGLMKDPEIAELIELEELKEMAGHRAAHLADRSKYWGTDSNNLWITMLKKALERAGWKG